MEHSKRVYALLSVFLVLFLILILRLFYLQVIKHSFYAEKSLQQRTRLISLAAQRGDILDRNGELLATSVDRFSVYKHGEGWLARKEPEAKAEAMKAADPLHISVLKEKFRVYPKKSLGGQVLGFVGSDNQGLSGIELSYDEYLRGKEGKLVTEGDPSGRELYGALRELEAGEDGMNVTLTIDQNIQYVAERVAVETVKKFNAASGIIMVMDIETGEILALASKPDFDPNTYGSANPKNWHPRFNDPYEPGSTFKVITTASGLQEGVISTETMLKALNSLTIGGRVIENSHQINWPGSEITISKMLEESINTGSSQIGIKLGPERFHRMLTAFGFGKRTGFGMYGESPGIFRNWKNWYKPDVAMMTFGQSISVTPMQLLAAVASLGNGGRLLKPFLVKKIESTDGNFVKVNAEQTVGQPISAKVSGEMKQLMRNVVMRGSGRKAAMASFAVCGKTGTAQKASPNGGYMKGHYIASYVGFAPMDRPRIACLVVVDDPRGVIWGETVAGPAFKDVVEYSLRYLNVKPDVI